MEKKNNIVYVPVNVVYDDPDYVISSYLACPYGLVPVGSFVRDYHTWEQDFKNCKADIMDIPSNYSPDVWSPYFEKGNFKHHGQQYRCVKISDNDMCSINNVLAGFNMEAKQKGLPTIKATDLTDLTIDDTTYIFISNISNINLNVITDLYVVTGDEPYTSKEALKKFLSFELPVGYKTFELINGVDAIGYTKDTEIAVLRYSNKKKDEKLTELSEKVYGKSKPKVRILTRG